MPTTSDNDLAPRLLKVDAAAKYLSISKWQLRRLIQAGEIPYIKLAPTEHAAWLVDIKDLDVWISKNKARN